ncbi:MAG: peptide-methionine (S)-S-oxide reductase MsrA [Anaerolineaceae bacterium]|jgi:peptide-methionine (S)-S-oxide reductase|nr:peptide-methionine (S)-S-oxide reductase MsrA [Anaerolineaceae bacterium]OQY88990.1 MAG: peptide-methionine (S)-S-oxide reductase [Anaerolineae bacterium UTCFX1]
MNVNLQTATLAGGCFWCLEAVFVEVKGVVSVESGYTGGRTAHPTYHEVCNGDTGHAEATQIRFNPDIVSYRDLLNVFFAIHDPTALNRQGNDIGEQYRSEIFYHNDEQKNIAEELIKELNAQKIWASPIVTRVSALGEFYAAEEYHRDYFARNPNQPYCQAVVAPKVAKFRKHFLNMTKQETA